MEPILIGLGVGLPTAMFGWLQSKNKRYVDQLTISVEQNVKLNTRIGALEGRMAQKDQEIFNLNSEALKSRLENERLKVKIDDLLIELAETTDVLKTIKKELSDTLLQLREAEDLIKTFQQNKQTRLDTFVSRLEALEHEHDNNSNPRI